MTVYQPLAVDDRPSRIGTRTERVEDEALLRGLGRYGDDVATPPGTLHATVVRSPHAHSRILALDTEKALALPGVHGVLTGAEVAQLAVPFAGGHRPDLQPPVATGRRRCAACRSQDHHAIRDCGSHFDTAMAAVESFLEDWLTGSSLEGAL